MIYVYLQVLDKEQLELAHSNDFNFDHPGGQFLLEFKLVNILFY